MERVARHIVSRRICSESPGWESGENRGGGEPPGFSPGVKGQRPFWGRGGKPPPLPSGTTRGAGAAPLRRGVGASPRRYHVEPPGGVGASPHRYHVEPPGGAGASPHGDPVEP